MRPDVDDDRPRKQTAGNAVVALVAGLVCVLVCVASLFGNEAHATRTHDGLSGALADVVMYDPTLETAALDGRLVHISARLMGQDNGRPIVSDREFGIAVAGVHLHRTVEMYQWRETRHDHTYWEDGEEKKDVTYSYDEVWSESPIYSDRFDDRSYSNPTLWPYTSRKTTHPSLHVETYALSRAIVDLISTPTEPIRLDQRSLLQMESVFDLTLHAPQAVDAIPALVDMFIDAETAFLSRPRKNEPRPHRSAIGDLRVSFAVTPAKRVSILAMPLRGSLVPYTSAGGVPIALVHDGLVPAETMLHHAQASLRWQTMGWRGLGLALSCLGYYGVLKQYLYTTLFVPSAMGPLHLGVRPSNRLVLALAMG
ncbi:hypothetical protein SPRG_16691 [Saprolegnia parasitica CBS 223.65]|uniref:Uncharacterized protein n=1 Tax=Saprolegnia parasitica (strain CBS 223.65) TaxID=695850 RepID=A0A067BIB3_SAPPC|nr:hypothetical protein SPRG_16691 [Saprolegnia parasitica CBS 223.65]KDO17908.1 hypothetical protein SPRG_16691 [Saprolegnia parasitica CBS 223.65]|eukprot:XP_012211387.1 hypothetical protein SPRG_16691 [Saprolegnia parasitica CBS 223.65]